MIKKPNNWDSVQAFSNRPKLPLDAYVCKVIKGVVQTNDYGDQLCVLFDIAEGEQSGFYAREFKANTMRDKKWKGVLRVWLPLDDGSEKDDFTKSALKGFVTSLENSNTGYQWDWDENSLAGKLLGIMFRNEEWEFNGKTGWTVRPLRAMSVETVRDGDYTLPDPKPLKGKSSSYDIGNAGMADLTEDDEEFPF